MTGMIVFVMMSFFYHVFVSMPRRMFGVDQ